METYFLIIVIILFVFAISDLVVGVSNDAVNFLNSALGSKAAPFKLVMFIAACGILARPGERVIVRLDAEDDEREAMVAVGTGQLMSAGGIRPAGTVLRLA